MGSKLDQDPSSIFFDKDPYIPVILLTNIWTEKCCSLAGVQVPIFIDRVPTFFGHGGGTAPTFQNF